MATVVNHATYANLVAMHQSDYQDYLRASQNALASIASLTQGQAMGAPTGGNIFQQMYGQSQPIYPYPQYASSTGTTSVVGEKEPPEDTSVKGHLQRRVNKWLRGVKLPLH